MKHLKRNWHLMLFALVLAATLHFTIAKPAASDTFCGTGFEGQPYCADNPGKIPGASVLVLPAHLEDYDRYTRIDVTPTVSYVRDLVRWQRHNDLVASSGVTCYRVYNDLGTYQLLCP